MSGYVHNKKFSNDSGRARGSEDGYGKAFAALGTAVRDFSNDKIIAQEKKDTKLDIETKEKNQVASLKKLYGRDGGILEGWTDDEVKGLGNGSSLNNAIATKNQAGAKRNFVAAYRIKHPKFSGDLNDNELYSYIKSAGQSVVNPDNGKVIDVHTSPDGSRYASVRQSDGTIKKEYLGKAKTDWNKPKSSSKKNKEVVYDLSPGGKISQTAQKKANTIKEVRKLKINDSDL